MASFLDKFKIKTAYEKNTSLDLSCTHVTTSDWMDLSPIYIKEMVPGESIDIKMSTFTRLAPMAVPTLGRGLIHNRAFFVPMRTVFGRWDEFITRAPGQMTNNIGGSTSYVSNSNVPYIEMFQLAASFFDFDSSTGAFIYRDANGSNHDTSFCEMLGYVTYDSQGDPTNTQAELESFENADIALKVVNSSGGTQYYYYNLKPLGRSVYKILQSLGYQVTWTIYDNAQTSVYSGLSTSAKTEIADIKLSLLPLKSFIKAYVDWYWPSQYCNNAYYNGLKSFAEFTPQSSNISLNNASNLRTIWYYLVTSNNGANGIAGVTVNYDSDYFVSAFDTPEGPTNNFTGTLSLPNIDISSSVGPTAGQITNGVTSAVQSGTANMSVYNNIVTQYGLNALRAMTDYLKRHQLVGSRAIDRFYARFGINLGSEKLLRSNYIGSMNIPLQFGDVMSHTDSSVDSPLGAYAGKGLGYGENGFSFKADDYGYIIILSSIVPQIGYYQGIDRTCLHISPTDFYTPEFDQLGNQAIARYELNAGSDNLLDADDPAISEQVMEGKTNDDLSEGLFGWTPRYSEYKIGRDRLTGDFRLNSKNAVGDTTSAWHLFRDTNGLYQDADTMFHSLDFATGKDAGQYNRLFYSTTDSADKFYLIHNFQVTSNSPMHSLYDSYEFDSNGDSVVADVNGVKVN